MAKIPTSDLPSNSKTERPKVKAVAQGVRIAPTSKPLILRILESTSGVWEYVLWDVLIPAAKDTLNEMVANATEMMLFGKTNKTSRRIKRSGSRSYVSYNSIYDKSENREPVVRTARQKASSNFDDIRFVKRGDAEAVLDILLESIEMYEFASVSDFYEAAGVAASHTDTKYGWENLSQSRIERVKGGYILILPRPQPLD